MKRRRKETAPLPSAYSGASTLDTRPDVAVPPPKMHKSDQIAAKVNSLVLDTLHYIQSLFPSEAFSSQPPLPPIVLKHQLYSLSEDRTVIDRELVSLRDNGLIRMFKLGVSEQDYALVEEHSYQSFLQAFLHEHPSLHHKLTREILPQCKEVSLTQHQLKGIKDNQLGMLVRHGVLLPRDVGKNKSWWFGIPGVSPFIKSLIKGRSTVQQMVKRSKFSELLQSELEIRKLHVSKLKMEYHIHDLIGSDQLERVSTTSGPLLRLWSRR